MIRFRYLEEDKMKIGNSIEEFNQIDIENIIWIDLIEQTKEEVQLVGESMGVELTEVNDSSKIEHSARFSENENYLAGTTNILFEDKGELVVLPVSFVVSEKYCITQHAFLNFSFDNLQTELENLKHFNAKSVFLKIYETIIEFDIDLIENYTSQIADLGNKILVNEDLDEDLMISLSMFQKKLMSLRLNIIEHKRIISSISKSARFNHKSLQKQIDILEKDVNSLLEYITFDFERLEYLQDTFMGLINMKQNTIMKIFTIVSVIFLPPTLIASIYGMNFHIPELTFPYGYPIVLGVMVCLSIIILLLFKHKKWL